MRVEIQPLSDPVGAGLQCAVKATLARAGDVLGIRAGELVLRFVSRDSMAQLNGRWRGKERPTDVISFPSNTRDPDGETHLGDIAICLDVARDQAREQGHDLTQEVALLALHGLLHIMGYDHESDDGEMEALEELLRSKVLSAPQGGFDE